MTTSLPALLTSSRSAFEAAMDDDLNVSAALASVFDLVRELNRRIAERTLSDCGRGPAAAALRDLDRVLAVAEDDRDRWHPSSSGMLEERAAARASRDWARSDALREELAQNEIVVEDTPDGQRWRRDGGRRWLTSRRRPRQRRRRGQHQGMAAAATAAISPDERPRSDQPGGATTARRPGPPTGPAVTGRRAERSRVPSGGPGGGYGDRRPAAVTDRQLDIDPGDVRQATVRRRPAQRGPAARRLGFGSSTP